MVYASGDLTIAVCDRCRTKVSYKTLRPDGQAPGLRVCLECRDNKDPYRLPARKTEGIALQKPRPDTSVATTDTFILTEQGLPLQAEDGTDLIT